MIAKHIPMEEPKKSNFARLVRYVTDGQVKAERLGSVRVTNCLDSSSPEAVIDEVLDCQERNTKAVKDKNYHLMVSFRAGEIPSAQALIAIEERLCQALGYGEHQRISAVHGDTDHLHLHMAINKVHPTRNLCHTPFNDYRTIARTCTQLEAELGLLADNHTPTKTRGENRAADMEHAAGIESLLGFIQREVLADLRQATSWEEAHRTTQAHGLALRLQGNGLVFASQDGTTVKASSVARELSKPKLEARFGPFQPPGEQAVPPSKPTYEPRPLVSTPTTPKLFATYKAEQKLLPQVRREEMDAIHQRRQLANDKARAAHDRYRTLVKLIGGNSKLALMLARFKLKAHLKEIAQQAEAERHAVALATRRRAWLDWLQHQAERGNVEALEALRARQERRPLSGNILTAEAIAALPMLPLPRTVTKTGKIIARVDGMTLCDDGQRLQITRGCTQEGLETALRLAMARHGGHLSVAGSPAFQERIARAAVAARLPLTFDDPALEQRRQTLETARDPRRRARARTSPRAHGGRPASPRGAVDQPHDRRSRYQPPPPKEHRVRELSALPVVGLDQRAEVLLPDHARRHLEHLPTPPPDPVRRPEPGVTAAETYIAERNAKRTQGFKDIPEHRLLPPGEIGPAAYAGVRRIEGQNLALVRRGETVLVLPVEDNTAQGLRRLLVGDPVTITPEGSVKTKGRGR